MSESVEDAYAGAIRRLLRQRDALAAELAAERARAERLRKALKNADSRLIQYQSEDWSRHNDGRIPDRDWFRRALNIMEGNHYANDGLQFGDLDGDLPASDEGEVAT